MQLRPGAAVLRSTKSITSRSLLSSSSSRCAQCRRTAPLDLRLPLTSALYHSSSRRSSAWGAAVSVASNIAANAVNRVIPKGDMHIDPLRTVAKEMKFLTGNIRKLLGSGHPSLDRVAKYYTQAEGKHMRPLIVLLMSRATALCPKGPRLHSGQAIGGVDTAMSPPNILVDVNPSSPLTNAAPEPAEADSDILPSQRRLAEITELIHTASLLLKNTEQDERRPVWSEETLTYYLQKTYLKTASLISKSCRASAILGGSDAASVEAAYAYGKNLGLAFQLVDDMLDYTRSEKELGKPAGADLELGLATAPLLFAWKTMPELGALVGRKFEQEGDVARARELVLQSDGIEQTRALAQDYSERAIAAISEFPDSEAKDGLVEMAVKALKRTK